MEAPQISRETIVESLRRGDTRRFFDALALDPSLLKDPEVYGLTIGVWFSRKVTDKKARDLLLRVGEALAFIGKGKPSQNTRLERRIHTSGRNSRHGASRNDRQAARRLVEKMQIEEKWHLRNGRTAEQARREAIRYVVSQFKATSRANDKSAILAIFKKIRENS